MSKKLEKSICFSNSIDYGLHPCDVGVLFSMDIRIIIEALTFMMNPNSVTHDAFDNWTGTNIDKCQDIINQLNFKMRIANEDALLEWVTTNDMVWRNMSCRQTVYQLKKKPYLKEGYHYKQTTPHRNSPTLWHYSRIRAALKENEDHLKIF